MYVCVMRVSVCVYVCVCNACNVCVCVRISACVSVCVVGVLPTIYLMPILRVHTHAHTL